MNQRDRLIELIEDYTENVTARELHSQHFNEKFADHLLANGVIVPPCKVGDKVYYLNTRPHIALRINKIYEASVVRIAAISLGVGIVIQIRDDSGCCEIPNIMDFGKTVFLSREEAEKALKEDRK